MATLDDILSELRALAGAFRDLIATNRYSRGGYDGPFIRTATFTLIGATISEGTGDPIAIFNGAETPRCILIEWEGTGVPGDLAFVNDDPQFHAGFILNFESPGSRRIIAAEHQRLWAIPKLSVKPEKPPMRTKIRVYEGRL